MRVVPLSIAASVAFAFAANAQDIATHQHDYDGTRNIGHAENHDWYQGLTQPGTGYSCCNGTVNGVEGDCRPTRAYLQRQRHVDGDGQRPLDAGAAARGAAAPGARWQFTHLCREERHDLLFHRRLTEES